MALPYRPKFFMKYPEYIPPTSEEEARVDPRVKLKPACYEKCKKYTELYDQCVERVEKRIKAGDDHGQCLGQHYDLVGCVDNCVAKDLFRYLA